MKRHDVTAVERVRQAARLLEQEGAADVMRRLRVRGARLVAPATGDPLPLAREDLLGASRVLASGGRLPAPLPVTPGEPLRVAWVDVPPSKGSGGQTTIYRMIEHLERNGCVCTMYLMDRHGWHVDQHRRTVSAWWPGVQAEIRDVKNGITDAHVILATCWESAYPVLASPAAGARLYFIQDYEPLFHPAGSLSMLAQATYGFGFRGITAGRWLAEKVSRDHGMVADHFDFGCDLTCYQLDTRPGAAEHRTGIAYYCRPSTPRRAHELALVALELFSEQHPEVQIHFYGEPVSGLRFPATHHGLLTPQALGALYNRCVAGLVLSATNVSLVPHEMLGAGCIPVVNDGEHSRLVLANDHVVYAPPTPVGLAAALSQLVSAPAPARASRAAAAAGSVMSTGWDVAGNQVLAAIRAAVASYAPVVG